jgi:hypothetical protein
MARSEPNDAPAQAEVAVRTAPRSSSLRGGPLLVTRAIDCPGNQPRLRQIRQCRPGVTTLPWTSNRLLVSVVTGRIGHSVTSKRSVLTEGCGDLLPYNLLSRPLPGHNMRGAPGHGGVRANYRANYRVRSSSLRRQYGRRTVSPGQRLGENLATDRSNLADRPLTEQEGPCFRELESHGMSACEEP